jgi:GTPase-activating protein BEM2
LSSISDILIADSGRSVLDLSLAGHGNSLDYSGPRHARHACSPVSPQSTRSAGGGLGDLRNISRKPWSRSADDLGKFAASGPPTSPLSIDTTFREKVVQYRKASLTGSADDQLAPQTPKNEIFPSSPKSPARSQTQPVGGSGALLSPSSSPSTEAEGGQLPTNRVHVRSNSFTPRLASKLAPAKISNLIPPKPRRKGSSASEDRVRVREESAGSSASTSTSKTHPVFPFALAANSSGGLASGHSNALNPVDSSATRPIQLNPPMIIEPSDIVDDTKGRNQDPDGKRSSEIVYQSGFVNRLPSFQPNPYHEHHLPFAGAGIAAGSLGKGWKPYKAVLKGSKLYFYKPPHDRAAAVKDLFVEGVVPMVEEEEEDERKSSDKENTDSAGGDTGTLGKRKRAYWGRRTHPSLIQTDGQIEKGTLDAIVHEAVFGTTFVSSEDPQESQLVEVSDEAYQDFASAVILVLPSIIGQAKFETEFFRCCDFFVNGADGAEKAKAKARVTWLASEYLADHGKPADSQTWDEWRKNITPDVVPLDIPSDPLPDEELTYTPEDDDSDLDDVLSPDFGTLSPRPAANDRMVSLVEILKAGPPDETRPSTSRSRQGQPSVGDTLKKSSGDGRRGRSVWTLLERDGLSREVFLMLDPHLIFTSLNAFHRSKLSEATRLFTLDTALAADGVSKSHPGVTATEGNDATSVAKSIAMFLGSDDRPHWLTKLVIEQVLGTEGSVHSLRAPSGEGGRSSQTSRTHKRSELISTWAVVGEMCRLNGDGCSWNAIQIALTSRPIARLHKAWQRVDRQARTVVQSWVYKRDDAEPINVNDPIMTPWASDTIARIKSLMESARGDDPDAAFAVEPLKEAAKLFLDLRKRFDICHKQPDVDEVDHVDHIQRLVSSWEQLAAGENEKMPRVTRSWRCVGHRAVFTVTNASYSIDQFMSLSLAAEPRQKGLYEPYFWTRGSHMTATPQTHPLLPLLFPEPLPTVHFIDRELIARARVDSSSAPLNMQDVPFLRVSGVEEPRTQRRSLDPSTHRASVAGLDLGGTVIPLFDNELVLVVQSGPDPTAPSRGPSRPSSRPSSRPPSLVAEGGTPEKLLARGSSIRVKAGSSHGLDRKMSLARRSSLPSLSSKLQTITTDISKERPLRVVVRAGTLDRLVGILIHGLEGVSVSVADDIGEMPLREGKSRELKIDLDEFTEIWWNVFRSFVTPLVFFEVSL